MSKHLDRRRFLATVGGAAACAGFAPWRIAAAAAPSTASHALKLGWRLGCCAYSLNWLTFYETVDKVASLGLNTVVGFNWQKLDPQRPNAILNEKMPAAERRETKRRLADAGVKLACCYCGDLSHEDACCRLFEFAREMGIETLDGEPTLGAFDMLEKLCDEYHINVAVHNHARPSPYWKPETLLAAFRGRSRRIGACCDTGHWARSGLNPVATLQKLQGRILTFDLKDVDAQGMCVPFGTGKGDIGGILRELARQRFRGVIGIEYDQRPPDIDKELAQCIVYLDNVAKELAST